MSVWTWLTSSSALPLEMEPSTHAEMICATGVPGDAAEVLDFILRSVDAVLPSAGRSATDQLFLWDLELFGTCQPKNKKFEPCRTNGDPDVIRPGAAADVARSLFQLSATTVWELAAAAAKKAGALGADPDAAMGLEGVLKHAWREDARCGEPAPP